MKESAAIWEDIDNLVAWDKNPRHNQAAIQSVADSIRRFGFASPIIARMADKMVIAGHTRLLAAKRLNLEKVPVRYLDLDPADARMLALADNKIGEIADWDNDKLMEVLEELRQEGQDVDSLGFVFDDDDMAEFDFDDEFAEEVLPQVKFSEYIDESNNYIVLLFDNDMDWLAAQTHFGLETKTSRRQNGKAWSSGIGRVVNGADYITKISSKDLDGAE